MELIQNNGTLQIIAIVMGATGFWKLLELLLVLRKSRAETTNLYTQVNNQVLSNWVAWSKKLEERIKDLEDRNSEMIKTIGNLETQIKELERQNAGLRSRIAQLTS